MAVERAFVNGKIYTVDASKPWAEAIAISGGRIVAVGSNDEVRATAGPATLVTDLGGRFMMPGLIDAHLHFLHGARYLSQVGVRDARTMAEVLRRLKEYADRHPQREWIVGQEFSYGYEDLGGDFHKSMFDDVVADRPVYFRSGMAHAGWANSRALELAGIDRNTPDPEGGVIIRDAAGEPTGWLKETAMALVERLVPPATPDATKAELKVAVAEANRLGITRVQSAGFDDEIFPLLAELRAEKGLTLRFGLSTVVEPPAFSPERLEELLASRQLYDDEFLKLGVVKLFLDGVLESHTGSMPEGYADRPEEKGVLLWEVEPYSEAVRIAQENGFQVWTHAIGTGAIARALDGYQADGERSSAKRPRVEHVEIPTQADVERFKTVGAIASFQPAMIYPKDQWMGMPGVWETRVGSERMGLAFPVRSVLDAGGTVAFGTDWPIVDLNPLIGIRNAVLRQSSDHEPAEGWVPAQRITLEEAIHAYTMGAAFAGHRETEEGSVSVGKLADLIVLSANPFEIDVDSLSSLTVETTILGGNVVHGTLSP